jgi:uncharacterized protein
VVTSRGYVSFLLAHSRWVLALAMALALVAGVRTVLTYAALKSDLEELLPAKAPSVLAIERARQRLPGLRHLGVVVDTGGRENSESALRFISDLERRVAAYPPSLVSAVRSGVAAERAFLETFALQLADPADVRSLRQAVEARHEWEVRHALGADLLDDAEDPAPAIPLQQLRDKYAASYGSASSFPGDRFLSEDGSTAVLVIQTGSQTTNFEADEELLERVKKDSAELGFPQAYAPGLRMGFAGDVATRVEEARGLVVDLGVSGAVVVALVLGAVLLFYRSMAAWPVLIVPVLFGALYTFGLVALPPLSIRYLNSNTAFLSSIIVGNGINGGIILLARVQEEAKQGRPIEDTLATAVRETFRPTLAAALAASAAYGSLIFTGFRGFRQFGWIGGLGMLMCWAVTYGLAPILIRHFGASLVTGERSHRPVLATRIADLVVGHPRWLLAIAGLLLIGSVVGIVRRHADWLETDFSHLRRADSFRTGERYWGRRMDNTLHRYLTPTVILTDSADQAEKVALAARRAAANGQAGGLIASVRSPDAVLPPTRGESLEEARRLRQALTPSMLNGLPAEDRERVERLISDTALRPLTPADVPAALAAGLRDKDGRLDRNVLIFPVLSASTWDADRLDEFARDIRGLAHAVSPDAVVAGPLLLSSDLIDALRSDGPRATAIAFGAALLVCLLAFRSVSLSLLAVGSLMLGVLLMLGATAWAGQRLNFSNFIALPITFGVAADYSINILKRYQSSRSILAAVANTGGAIALCSLATVIGFGSLLVAQNRALFSFGVLAVTGEIACLATAVLVLPAFLGWRMLRATPHSLANSSRLGLDP